MKYNMNFEPKYKVDLSPVMLANVARVWAIF